MEMYNYSTKIFKNIFPNYQTFSEWYASSPLSNGLTDIPSNKTFRIISNEYNDCHVCMTEESFKEHFENELYTYYKEFEATTKAIDELMELTDAQVEDGGKMIVNMADIPENVSSTDADTVNFISQHQKTLTRKGVLQIKREQISNKRAYTVRRFLERFRHLFIRVISPYYTTVYMEKDED